MNFAEGYYINSLNHDTGAAITTTRYELSSADQARPELILSVAAWAGPGWPPESLAGLPSAD